MMMHRMLWWIIIIIIISLHQSDLFCKTLCTQTEVRSSRGFESRDKGCSRSNGDQPSLSPALLPMPFILWILREGGKRNTHGLVISGGRCEIHRCSKNPSRSCLLSVLIHCLPSRSLSVFLSVSAAEKTDPSVALPSQSEEHAVANHLLLPKILALSLSAHRAPQARLLDPSPRNGTWNLCCCGLASKFLYHNETSAIESRESLFRWPQQSGIDETAQTVLVVVTRVPCTFKHHLLGHHFPSPRSPEPRSAIFYSCVRTTKWRESRQSSGRRRRKRKEGNNDTQEEEEEDAEEMHALPPHLAYILLSISAHKSSDAKRSSYFPCSFLLLLLRRRVSLLFVSFRLCGN